MSSQDRAKNINLLELLNGIRERESKKNVIPVATLIKVDESHRKFSFYWLYVMGAVFIMAGFAGTRFWPSVISLRVFDFLFSVSVHIYYLFGLLRSMVEGEFEKPIQYSVCIAVPLAAIVNVGFRLSASGWAPSVPTFFGHPALTATRDWLYNTQPVLLNIGYFSSIILLFVILCISSRVKLRNLLIPFLFYILTSLVIVYFMNQILALFSRFTTDAIKWVAPPL